MELNFTASVNRVRFQDWFRAGDYNFIDPRDNERPRRGNILIHGAHFPVYPVEDVASRGINSQTSCTSSESVLHNDHVRRVGRFDDYVTVPTR